MKFSEFELIMNERGINSLAEIARNLDSTPQAVSNWKARDQVPHHIVAQINSRLNQVQSNPYPYILEEGTISLSDILLGLAEQLKIILLIPFITVFLTFTYVKFIQLPEYTSWATILIPENNNNNLSGFAGLAQQFGVRNSQGIESDLSSPTFFPELLKSRVFAEKVLEKTFYSKKYEKELSLLSILNNGKEIKEDEKEIVVAGSIGSLLEMIKFEKDTKSAFSILTVSGPEPIFTKQLADVILLELEQLNRYYKSKTVNEKISFINNRINSVSIELDFSERSLKNFNEKNRQISSPSLLLEQERLNREVEIQKGIFVTLKQQLELAKIEEIQRSSIVQILDNPQIPLGPKNNKLFFKVFLSGVFGLGFGIFFGFIRLYLNNKDINERKKLRRVKSFINKKSKDFLNDPRVLGIVSTMLFIGAPIYLTESSENPIFFGLYSFKLLMFNIFYILLFLFTSTMCFYLNKKNKWISLSL